MQLHIMVDLETLATSPDALITAVSAVKFDPAAATPILDSYYAAVSIDSQEGRRVSASTLGWRMQQSSEARQSFSDPHQTLEATLRDLRHFIGNNDMVWAYGAAFGVPILEDAYTKANIEIPWNHRNIRCLRTLKAMLNHHTFKDSVRDGALEETLRLTHTAIDLIRIHEEVPHARAA